MKKLSMYIVQVGSQKHKRIVPEKFFSYLHLFVCSQIWLNLLMDDFSGIFAT
jgi:hypothetical protein